MAVPPPALTDAGGHVRLLPAPELDQRRRRAQLELEAGVRLALRAAVVLAAGNEPAATMVEREVDRQSALADVRPCAMGCGLAAAAGDVYCPGCRSGVRP